MPAGTIAEAVAEGRFYVGFDLTLDQAYRFSSKWPQSDSRGQYEGRVDRWGSLSRSSRSKSGHIETPEMTVVVFDPKNKLSDSMGGPFDGAVIGVAATIILMADNVEPYVFFSGLIGRVRPTGDRLWEFVLRVDDLKLVNAANIPVTDKLTDPYIEDSVIGTSLPTIYGLYLSHGVTTGRYSIVTDEVLGNFLSVVTAGEVTAFNTSIWRNSFGVNPTTVGLWEADVPMPLANGIFFGLFFISSFDHLEINPKNWGYYGILDSTATYLDFTKQITVDIIGHDTVKTVPAPYYTQVNPAIQIKHFIVNFVYNQWREYNPLGDNWFSDSSAPVDVASFDTVAAYFKRKKITGTLNVEGSFTGQQVIDAWAEQWGCRFYWTAAGKIAVSLEDHAVDPVIDSRHLRLEDFVPGQFGGDGETTDDLLTDAIVEYGIVARSGTATERIRVSDPDRSQQRQVNETFNYAQVGAGV